MKQNMIAWLKPHLNALPTEAKALCLNLYENEADGEFDAQLIGSATYDREDPDWACEDIYSTGEELFGFSSEDWEAALDLMLETMGEAIADGMLPDAIEYVAVGFVDGDLEEVFCRE